jgi:hypothetical protein
MFSSFLTVAAKAALSLLMSLATQEFFREIIVWTAEKAAKSSKTEWDDELIAKIKRHLGE